MAMLGFHPSLRAGRRLKDDYVQLSNGMNEADTFQHFDYRHIIE
jgi:hypothetical protein